MSNIITNLYKVIDSIWLECDTIETSAKDILRSYINSNMYLDQVEVELICIDDIVREITSSFNIEERFAVKAVKVAVEYMMSVGMTDTSYLNINLFKIHGVTEDVVNTIKEMVKSKLSAHAPKGMYRLPIVWKWNCLIILVHTPRHYHLKGEYALQHRE